MTCDDSETVEHAYARRAAPHGLPQCATSTLRRLNAAPPPHSASTLPLPAQMSHCSTRRRPMRT